MSYFSSLQCRNVPMCSPNIHPDVSFIDAVWGGQLVVGGNSSFGDEVGKGVIHGECKEDVTFLEKQDSHAKLGATVLVPNKCLFNEVEEFSKGGELAVTLSSSEVLDKEKDLCNQIVGLRRQMERLEKLVTQLASGGPVVQELKCQVCGFLLKAHKATTQINNLSELHIHVMGNLAMRGTSLGKPSVQLNSLECGPFLKQIELGSLGNVGVALMEN